MNVADQAGESQLDGDWPDPDPSQNARARGLAAEKGTQLT
jgi:hypothetical protein